MNCDERQRAIASNASRMLSEEDFKHFETCDSCTQALIAGYMVASVEAGLGGRLLPTAQLLLWKSKLRQKRLAQEPIASISGLATLGLYLVGLTTAVTLSMWIFWQHRLSTLIGAPASVYLLCVGLLLSTFVGIWAVRTALGEIAAQYSLLRKHYSSVLARSGANELE